MKEVHLLIINPGSTSTKIALAKNNTIYATKILYHDNKEIPIGNVTLQIPMRLKAIEDFLQEEGVALQEFDAIVARGGLLKPIKSGTYIVNEKMLNDLYEGKRGFHASNLGGIIARTLADKVGVEAYIVDPPSVDEFDPRARYSGLPELPRHSQLHALNIRRVALRVAQDLNKRLEECHFVVAHLGGGVSICAMAFGKMIDVNNANNGGPFSPERAAGLPPGALLRLCFSQQYTEEQLRQKLLRQAGLVGYLGTNDGREIEERIRQGDDRAQLVFKALGYQVIKEIGAMAAILPALDGIILTGGLAYSAFLTDYISSYVSSFAPIYRLPGEYEMLALAEGVTRVFEGLEAVRYYDQ